MELVKKMVTLGKLVCARWGAICIVLDRAEGVLVSEWKIMMLAAGLALGAGFGVAVGLMIKNLMAGVVIGGILGFCVGIGLGFLRD